MRLAAKNSFIKAAHSSARIPFTTCVLGCNACEEVIVKLETSQQNTEDTGGKQHLAAGEKVTLAVRSENILLLEAAVIGNLLH